MHRRFTTAEAAEQAFYAAMAAGDLDRMMTLWADQDGAVCNHPGGPRLIGLPAIRASFREIFSNGGVRIDTTEVQAFRTADMAVHSLIERIAVEGRGGSEVVEAVATNVFVRTGGHWRILVHHAGVFDGAEDADVDLDEDQASDEDPHAIALWNRGLPGIDRGDDADDDGPESEPRRPPPGRLH
jgi:uncharacterized protein (TIGR02246 family)